MAIGPFQWGGGGEKLTYEQAKKRREVADALAAKGEVPQTFGAGLNRIGEALLSKSYGDQATAAETAGADSRKAVIDALLGNPDPTITDIAGALNNDWVANDAGSSAVVQALLGQEMQQNDPLRQQQLRAGDLDIERAEFELDALRNKPPPLPGAPKTEKVYDPETGREKVVQWNENTGSWDDLGGVSAPKEPLVQVNTGDAMPGLGKLSNDYSYLTDENGKPIIDPNTNLPTAAPVPGSPADIAAQQAAAAQSAQEGAQLSSNIEGAEKTLASTRNVLEILDNAEGQPTTGTLSRPFAMLSNTPAGRIRSYVSTLQSGVALGAMQRLKEASSTGATGFGALSAPELNLLISDIGALDPDNTEPDIFRETVQRIEDRSKRVVADIRRNVSPERIAELGLQEFLDTFDPPANQSSPDNIDDILKGYGL